MKSALEENWNLIREEVKNSVDPSEFRSWIEPLKASFKDENELFIQCPNKVFYQGFIDRFSDRIERAKAKLGLKSLRVKYKVHETDQAVSADDISPDTKQEDANFGSFHKEKTVVATSLSKENNLNPNYTFNSFVLGESNQFAHATCYSVAENPGLNYNPLFIYGSTGLGKTHLLNAVGIYIQQKNPNMSVTYISSERFMNEMIYCLRFNKMIDFRNVYRNADVFLVDDIQFISGKERTQEEFFHTFNSLYESKKQIVITSDLFPQDIPDIEERLRNRFQWGLIADIQAPSIEHRIAILQSKAEKLGVNLSDDVCLYIASHAKRNIRELEGALHRLTAFSTLHGRPIDIDLASETFQNVRTDNTRSLSVEMIQKIVSDYFKIRIVDLKSKKRQRTLTVPRQLAMYLCREKLKLSFPEIGTRFGGKDHSTVMHACKKIEKDLKKDLDLKTSMDAIERRIDQHY